MLSFEELRRTCPEGICGADVHAPDAAGLWGRALEQMKTSYFEALLNGEPSLHARIKPVYSLLERY
jgi:hypothetical protein